VLKNQARGQRGRVNIRLCLASSFRDIMFSYVLNADSGRYADALVSSPLYSF